MPSWDDFSPRNPTRPPSWRWSRAQWSVSDNIPLRRGFDDPDVAKIIAFYSRWIYDDSHATRYALELGNPGLYWAVKLHESALSADRVVREELEARLLAGSDDDTIAHHVKVEPRCVHWYERAFFSVREYLDRPGYILHCAIGSAMHDRLSPNDKAVLWRLFGYFGGPLAVDFMTSTFSGRFSPETSSALMAFVNDTTKADLTRSAMIAAKTLRIDSMNAVPIIEQFLKLEEAKSEGGAAAQSEMVESGLVGMLTSLQRQFSVYVPDRDADTMALIPEVDLRAGELLALDMGIATLDPTAIAVVGFPDRDT